MLREITQKLLEGGEAALRNLIGRAESFELEFKTKENPNNHILSKNDKRNLGKALSGFSNADGGVVVFGIETKRKEHQDSAHELRPIEGITRFKSEVDGRLGELLRPANPSIATYAVPCADNPDRGYLLIDIGRSEFRPHMSMAPDHQKYFRRSVEGTLIMDHSLIRDLMMAPKEARIEPKWRISGRSSTGHGGKRIINGSLDLYLVNVGLAMAAMPYARIWMNPKLNHENVNPAAPSSPRPDGSVAYYGTRDSVIHPSDEVRFGGFRITMTVEYDTFHRAINSDDLTHAVAPEIWGFGTEYDRTNASLRQEFEALKIDVSFGAENTQDQRESFYLTKYCLLNLALDGNIGLLGVEKSKLKALAQALEAIEDNFGPIAKGNPAAS